MEDEYLTREQLIEALRQERQARRALEDRSESPGDYEQLLHQLRVHQVELETQNQALREAQGQVEESRGRFVDLYDFAPIPYCTFDRDGLVLEINLTGATVLGRERSRILGKPFLAIVHLDDPDSFSRHIRNSLDSTIPVMTEISFSSTQGRQEFQLISAPIRRAHGPPASCRTAFLDITHRRIAERDARLAHQSEKSLRNQLEGIDRTARALTAALAEVSGSDFGGFVQTIVDQARELVQAQYAALGIQGEKGRPFDPWVFSGMSAEQADAVGRSPRGVGLLGAVIGAGRAIRLRDLREHGSFSGFPRGHPPMTSFLGVPISYRGECRANLFFANKLGVEEFSQEDQISAEILADRIGIAMEIARLRQVEAREHTRLEFLAKAGPILAESIHYETTLHAIARLVVPTAADLSTIDLVEEGGSVRKVVAYHPDPAKQVLFEKLQGATPFERAPEDVRTAIATSRVQRRDVAPEFLRTGMPDPTYREILKTIRATCSLVAPLILRGRVIGVLRLAMAESGRTYLDEDVSIAQEIAHLAALAIDNARLYESAQAAIRARDNLLAVVSHDLRNYLAPIRTSADLLSRKAHKGDGLEGKKQIEVIQRAVTRLERLIESLRDATMIETGHFTIEAEIEDARAIVEEALSTWASQAELRSLRLIAEIPDRRSAVQCDRQRILQVISNLVGNAIKFTKESGSICIGAERTDDAVRFSVSDTGVGMPESQKSHAFERFWTGHRSTRSGTGLGLFIAKGIVEAHGGTIWMESHVGRGTTVFFTLPRAPDEEPSRALSAAPSSRRMMRRSAP